nr:uncharacterized protein LOC111421660 [Onthophagus taurus]
MCSRGKMMVEMAIRNSIDITVDASPSFSHNHISNSKQRSYNETTLRDLRKKRKKKELHEKNTEVNHNDVMEIEVNKGKRSNKETRKIREERKLKTNTGKEYITRSNKVVPEKH